jgi:hypothetical protein
MDVEVADVIFTCGRTKETVLTAWECVGWVESLGCVLDLLESLALWRNTEFVICINDYCLVVLEVKLSKLLYTVC